MSIYQNLPNRVLSFSWNSAPQASAGLKFGLEARNAMGIFVVRLYPTTKIPTK
jgi:hypothetical protein